MNLDAQEVLHLNHQVHRLRRAVERLLGAASTLEEVALADGTLEELNAAKGRYEAAEAHARKVLKQTK